MTAPDQSPLWPLACRLRGLLASRGYRSVRSASQGLGIPYRALARWCCGACWPQARPLGLLLRHLGATMEELLATPPLAGPLDARGRGGPSRPNFADSAILGLPNSGIPPTMIASDEQPTTKGDEYESCSAP
jgi:hypothetical protein